VVYLLRAKGKRRSLNVLSVKAEYLISTSLSVILHGAVAAGLYQSMLVGPTLDFSPGNFSTGSGGLSVSLVSWSDLGAQDSSPAQTVVVQAPEPAAINSKDMKPEVSLSQVRLQKAVERRSPAPTPEMVARPQRVAPSQQANGAPSSTVRSEERCEGSNCDPRAALGGGGSTTASVRPSVVYAPKPPYPWAARRAGFEGSLVAMVEIAKDGRVKAAQLLESSGREDCDLTALNTIRERWRFEPARFLGQPVEWSQRISIVYSLRQ
jgi:protein TonB